MWICPACDQPVATPDKKKCPSGHALYDWHIGWTRELSLMPAFFLGIFESAAIVLIGAAIGMVIGAMAGYKEGSPSETRAGDIGVLIATLWLPIYIVIALRRAAYWRQRGGAVARLAPRARGFALGSIVTIVLVIILAIGQR